jgi:chemotaxis protein MotB
MRKKENEPQTPSVVDPNLGLAISLFIIILAFFIMLNAFAVVDENRKRLAIGSLLENFGILSGGNSLSQEQTSHEAERLSSPVRGFLELNKMIKGDGQLIDDVVITGDSRRSTVRISASRLFAPGSASLKSDTYPLLDKIASLMAQNQYPVDIMGFADIPNKEARDEIPPRELSALQAMAVQAYFLEKHRIPPKQLTAYGWGEFRPVVAGNTRETRQINRRVEIVFVHESKQKKPEGAFTFKDFFFNVFDKSKE